MFTIIQMRAMESGYASTSEPEAATVFATTTGSFQNQSPPAPSSTPARVPACTSRKRGISSLLQDISNGSDIPQTRRARLQAKKSVQSHCSRSAPRGNPAKGAKLRHRNRASTTTREPHITLTQLMHNKAMISSITETLLTYIQRNVSFEIQKAIAIAVMTTAIGKWGCSVVDAASHAADCTGFSTERVRKWAFAFVNTTPMNPADNLTDECLTDQLSSNRGHHDYHAVSLLNDEDFQMAARSFVRKQACRKGQPNLTSNDFSAWVQSEYSMAIHDSTARRWLEKLGFARVHHQKGVYFDGHDRDDVVVYRNNFLTTMAEYDKKSLTCDGAIPELAAGEKAYIRVVHDECTYYANCDQSFFWGDEETNVLRQKSLGASIMVSDFIDEVSGYIRDSQDQARLLLETHREGYFTNDLLIAQVDRTIDIFERIHPEATALFLFDNAPSHRKMPDDALNADKMNVGPGGKQPKMRATIWGGAVQQMVDESGTPKGMKKVLEERGVDTSKMRCREMRELLKTYPDFGRQKTILEDHIEQRGHICLFYPKFHCELSPIERVWCQSKKHTHAYADGTITRLRKIVPEGLDNVTLQQIKKFFRTCRDYEKAYREGGTGREVEEWVKRYKSHRRVYNTEM